MRLSIAQNIERRYATRAEVGDLCRKLIGILNDIAVEHANDVAGLEPGFVSRSARGDVFGKGAGRVRNFELLCQAIIQITDLDAKVPAGHLSGLYQILHDVFRHVRRNGKSNAH